jgi:hypothetical protein
VATLDAHAHRARRDAVSEPAVDAGFRRVQHRQRLAALGGVVELLGLDRGEDPAPPVGREDGDPAHRGRWQQLVARHGQLEREEPARPDDLVAVEGGERAVELEARPVQLEARGLHFLTERDEVRAREGG